MQIFSITDVGKQRKTNQDAYFAAQIEDKATVAIVCDGMGGANAGNIASETAIKSISDYIIRSYHKNMSGFDIEKMLKNAIASANIEIYDMACNDPTLNGMGTTVVVAFAEGDDVIIAHVGDSRAYLVSDEFVQLTRDHSIVQSLLESGKISPEDAKVHPKKNVITRALGVEESVISDCSSVTLSAGNTLLLCTDGLTGFVEAEDIFNTVRNTESKNLPSELVRLANDNGGGDNITVVALVK